MASRGQNQKPKTYLGKTNKKFAHVKPVVDTGASVSNYMGKIEEIRKNYRFRKDEIFKRMKVSTFAQLVLQVAEVVNLEMDKIHTNRSIEYDNQYLDGEISEEGQDFNTDRNGAMGTDRSVLIDLVRGLGELDAGNDTSGHGDDRNSDETNMEEMVTPEPTSLPFLLLDIRDVDAYNECHIIGAINYPSAMLNRTVNYLSKEMLTFKNKPGKIIIVYDDDEKLAPVVTTTLVQKELDNVIMLSGGMKVLHKKFPGCFLSGTVPPVCFSPKTDRKGNLKPTPKMIENLNTEWYTPELLEKIQDYLDEILLSNESSRMSSRTKSRSSTTNSRASTATVKSVTR